jgi:prepilin-type N-terminal cleavage/methylation domain-containing protein
MQVRHVRPNARVALRSGFTLLEILVVVAIIVVLAGVGAVYVLPQLEGAKEKIAKQKAAEIGNAAQMYYVNNNVYPSLQELTVPGADGKAIMSPEGILDPWGKPYTLDPSGQHNGGNKPDVFTTSPSGKQIGNW